MGEYGNIHRCIIQDTLTNNNSCFLYFLLGIKIQDIFVRESPIGGVVHVPILTKVSSYSLNVIVINYVLKCSLVSSSLYLSSLPQNFRRKCEWIKSLPGEVVKRWGVCLHGAGISSRSLRFSVSLLILSGIGNIATPPTLPALTPVN